MASRAMFRDTVLLRSPTGTLFVPQSSSAAVYDVGTTNPVSDTLYFDSLNPTTLPNPIPIGADGAIQFWTTTERTLDVVVSTAGYQPVRTTVMTDAVFTAVDVQAMLVWGQ